MAKLTGVKTVDMVNGEITKISYEGAEYARVDGEAMFGDVLLRVSGGLRGQVTVGEYYEGHDSSEGRNSVKYRDEEGDVMSTSRNRFVAFRKINTSQSDGSTLTAKVDELDSRVTALEKGDDKPAYKTEKRAAKVGERILVTKKRGFTMKDMTVGNTYEVVELGHDSSYVEVYDDNGDQASALSEGYEVIVEDTPAKTAPAKELEHNGETYTLVSRKAQAGDVVIPTGKSTSSFVRKDTPYIVDDRLKVEGFPVYKSGYNRTEANVLVYEKKAPALKVGDYVRVKDGADSRHGDIGAGEIVKVTDFGHYSSRKVRVQLLDDSDYDYFKAEDLELVDEKVVTFAKIGRKPNEFKKGDIVRVVDSPCAKPDGSIFEVQSLDLMGRAFCDESYVYNAYRGHIELVTPVESRVDSGARSVA